MAKSKKHSKKMNYKISFQELAQLQREQLSKQRTFTLKEKREQADRVEARGQKEIVLKTKNMDLNTSFQELTKLALKQIAMQKPATIENARMQTLWINNSELFISKFSDIDSLADAKKNAVEFLKTISDEDYIILHTEFVNSYPKKIRMDIMSFEERAKLGAESLAKQRPITVEIALEQKRRIEARRDTKIIKRKK